MSGLMPLSLLVKIRVAEDGCWNWQAATMSSGYGCLKVNRRVVLAHRHVYEWLRGGIPDGHQLHHTCGNKSCVNPSHLNLCTPKEHTAQHPNRRRRDPITHCKQGHELTPANIYEGRGWRECRTCRRDASRKLRTQRKAA